MRVKRLLVALFVLLAAAPVAYLLLALVLGLLPVNRDFLFYRMKKIADHFAARPAALANGLDALHAVISCWAND